MTKPSVSTQRVVQHFLMLLAITSFLLAAVGRAAALSPTGTPERTAEEVAINKVRTLYPAYAVVTSQVQMRSNKASISIPSRNRIGKQVNFKTDVRRVNLRSGGYRYEVGPVQVVQ